MSMKQPAVYCPVGKAPSQSFKMFRQCTGGVSALQAEPLENAIYNWRFLCLRLKSKCADRLNQPLRQIDLFFKEEKKSCRDKLETAVETNRLIQSHRQSAAETSDWLLALYNQK